MVHSYSFVVNGYAERPLAMTTFAVGAILTRVSGRLENNLYNYLSSLMVFVSAVVPLTKWNFYQLRSMIETTRICDKFSRRE